MLFKSSNSNSASNSSSTGVVLKPTGRLFFLHLACRSGRTANAYGLLGSRIYGDKNVDICVGIITASNSINDQ